MILSMQFGRAGLSSHINLYKFNSKKMIQVATYLITNNGGFRFGMNVQKQQTLLLISLDPSLIGALITLATNQGLIVTMDGGSITISTPLPPVVATPSVATTTVTKKGK